MSEGSVAKALDESIKSFLEHLRTVNFALLTTCLALFASLLPEPVSDLKIAQRDLERVRSALNSGALQKLAEDAFVSSSGGAVRESARGTYAFRLEYKRGESSVYVIAPLTAPPHVPLEQRAIPAFGSGDRFSISCAESIRLNLNSSEVRVDLSSQSSLESFIGFWNCLPKLRAIKVSEAQYPKAAAIQVEKVANNFVGVEGVVGTPLELRLRHYQSFEAPARTASFALNKEGRLQLEFPVGPLAAFSVTQGGPVPVEALNLGRSETNGYTVPVVLPLSVKATETKALQVLIDEFFPGATAGPFERRFAQLSAWAKNREARNATVLLEDIRQDLERASDSFEILGVKIPLSLIAKVGILVLIAIETYFCLHLRRLSLLLRQAHILPQFPWIGVYPDPLSRAFFVIAVAGIPVAVSAMLLAKSWNDLHYWTVSLLAVTFAAAQLFLLVQLRIFWKSWPRTR